MYVCMYEYSERRARTIAIIAREDVREGIRLKINKNK